MAAKTPPAGYSRLQIRLHWAVVILLVLQYALHDGVVAAFRDGLEAGTLTITAPAAAHFVAGTVIFLLMAWRLMLRSERGVPDLPEADPDWQKMVARLTHIGIYVLVLSLPVSGGLAWGMGSEAMAAIHGISRALLLLLILLHIAGALYGQFVQKTGIMDRMRRPVA